MSEQKEAAPSQPAHKPQRTNKGSKQSSGSSGAFLAMVIALGAAGGSYYLWQQHLVAQKDRQALKQSIERLLTVVEEKERVQLARIEQLAEHRHDETEQRLQALENSLPELSSKLSLQQHDWSLAEVDYLLRLAEHRLQLSHDIPTAITALSQAREQLISHTNGEFAAVIGKIEQNIQILSAIEQETLPRITARLGELIATVDTLPFAVQAARTPSNEPAPAAPAEGAEWQERARYWGQLVWHDIRSLVTIRRSDEVQPPLMDSEQRYLVQGQLRLKLETARLAAMGREQGLYRNSLQEAEGWLQRYFDLSDGGVIAATNALRELTAIDIDPSLPSLQPLRQLLHAVELLPQAEPEMESVAAPEPMSETLPESAAEVAVEPEPVTAAEPAPAAPAEAAAEEGRP